MAVTSFTQQIYDGFYSDDVNKALFHGHTFTANPTGCAAALASIQLLETPEMQANIQRIHQKHLAFKERISKHTRVKSTRLLGVIIAVELKTETNESYYGTLRNRLYDFFIEQGVLLRPVGSIIYILPPYVMTNEQLDRVYTVIEQAVASV